MLQLLLDRFFLLKRFFSDPASMFCQLIYQAAILPLIVRRQERVSQRVYMCSMFHSSHFSLLVFGHFWGQSYEKMKILCNLCYILQGKMGKNGKDHATKVTKIPKTKRQKYGMNETKFYCSEIQNVKIRLLTGFCLFVSRCNLDWNGLKYFLASDLKFQSIKGQFFQRVNLGLFHKNQFEHTF